jgi:hypothetical protein
MNELDRDLIWKAIITLVSILIVLSIIFYWNFMR